MRRWQLRSYVTSGGRSVVKDWFHDQTAKVQAKFVVTLTFLLERERTKWKREPYSPLSGQDGLGEIRFLSGRVQYRPIGFFGPDDTSFTILIHAIEKGDKLRPKQCLKTAKGRKSELTKNPKRAETCDWLWDDDEEASE